jgi:hypothetical protein
MNNQPITGKYNSIISCISHEIKSSKRNGVFVLFLLVLAVFIFQPKSEAMAQSHAAMTNFKPGVNGFHFVNSFKNDLVPMHLNIHGLNVHSNGLCGGMVYTALDYYYAHKPIPNVHYRPATGTRLARYIYHREVHSIVNNIPEWTNMFNNVGGSRNDVLFRRGLNGRRGGALANLIRHINHGKPVVIDLKGTGHGSHQVLAIGYDLGRYRGNFGPHEGDLTIKIYNPNHPGVVGTLTPDPRDHVWHTGDGNTWRGFFVDTRYQPKMPPHVNYPVYRKDDKIHELVLMIATGNNDLGGDHANVNLEVELADGSRQLYPDINRSARWLPNYTQNARVILRRPLKKQAIRKLILTDTFRSGINHDTWKMKSLVVKGLMNNSLVNIGRAGFKYFTIKDRRLEIPITSAQASSGQIDRLAFTIHTGGDALRGNHANLNIEIHYANGSVQSEPNVNHGTRWANNSNHVVLIRLDKAVRPQQIKRIVLVTTASKGFHSDKWNMQSIQVIGKGNGTRRQIASYGFNRFTPKKRKLVIRTVH